MPLVWTQRSGCLRPRATQGRGRVFRGTGEARTKDMIWGDVLLQELGPGEKLERERTSQGSATDEANRLCRELE